MFQKIIRWILDKIYRKQKVIKCDDLRKQVVFKEEPIKVLMPQVKRKNRMRNKLRKKTLKSQRRKK